jgi:hypothetical protein
MQKRAARATRELRKRLDDTLFPSPAAAVRTIGRGERAVVIIGLLTLGVVAQLARIGWSGSLNSLWAEDGSVFLQGALTQSFWHAVSTEYAGYLVLVPRLIGEAASAVPLHDAPLVVSGLSAALVGLSGLAVWYASAAHIANPYLRGALVMATVLTPVGGLETIDSASYASWYMLFATFWLLLWRPRTQLAASLAALLILATALSNPGVWFFMPLALLRAIAVRDRRDATIVGAFFAGAAAQAVAFAVSNYEAVEPVWTRQIWAVLLQRVVDGAALGLRLGGEGWKLLGWPLLIALAIAAAVVLAIGLRRATWSARCLAAIAVPTALLMFVASVYQRAVGLPMLWPPDSFNGSAGRYSIVPVMLLISVAMVTIEGVRKRRREAGVRPWLVAGTVALLLVSTAVSLPEQQLSVRGTPPWDATLDGAAATCAKEGTSEIAIPVSPPGFGMQLPCSTIPPPSNPGSQR